jgi:hypothetical protein
MNIVWPYFGVALLLLWLPRQWLRAGGPFFKRRRSKPRTPVPGERPDHETNPNDSTVYFRTEFSKFRNYVDFFRAAIGGLAMVGGGLAIPSALQPPADASGWRMVTVLGVRVAILLAGVLIQSIRFEKKAAIFPPIFYLSGLTLGLCGPAVAFFAVVITWAVNMMLPGPSSFLAIYALLVGAFGFLLRGDDLVLICCAVGLVYTPVLISMLAKRRLVHFSRKVKTDE